MIFYMIMHKATGFLMPQAKRDRGYSHWNPAVVGTKLIVNGYNNGVMSNAMPIPRLLDTRRRAAACIVQWATNPNARRSLSTPSYYTGEQDDIVDTKPDGRTKDDLVVVEVNITGLPEEARF